MGAKSSLNLEMKNKPGVGSWKLYSWIEEEDWKVKTTSWMQTKLLGWKMRAFFKYKILFVSLAEACSESNLEELDSCETNLFKYFFFPIITEFLHYCKICLFQWLIFHADAVYKLTLHIEKSISILSNHYFSKVKHLDKFKFRFSYYLDIFTFELNLLASLVSGSS